MKTVHRKRFFKLFLCNNPKVNRNMPMFFSMRELEQCELPGWTTRSQCRKTSSLCLGLFSAGLYMNQMGYPTHPYGSYHSLAQAGGMGGAMMTSQMAMMGQQQSGMMPVQQNSMMGQQNGIMGAQGVMAQPSGAVASPYMTGHMPQSMMGPQQSGMMVQHQNGIMGQPQSGMMVQQQSGMMGQQQVGGLATLPHQQVYGVQQTQQLQWNITQVCYHVPTLHTSQCVRKENA